MSNFFPLQKIGRVRFVVEKFTVDPEEKKKFPWRRGIEIHHHESFSDGFISNRSKYGIYDFACEVVADHEFGDNIADILKDSADGFYEILGDLHYEFDPGYDSPNGPAEADSYACVENPEILKLTEEQTDWWLPKDEPKHHFWCNYQHGEVSKCPQCADLNKRFPAGDMSEHELRAKYFPEAVSRAW